MWLLVSLVILIIALVLYWDTRKPLNYPPGPAWFPILGSAYTLQKLREKTGYFYKAADQLVRHYGNKGVLGLKVGKDRIVVVCGLDATKEMLFNEDIDGRPRGVFYETRTWGQRKGIILIDGELWREQRRFIVKHLKEFGFGRRGMADIIRNESEHLFEDMTERANVNNNGSALLQMHDAFTIYVLNTLWSMMAGKRYSPKDPEMQHIQALLFDLFSKIDMVGTAFSHFPILTVLAPKLSGYTKFVDTHSRIWKFLREELENHKKTFNADQEDRDFMDAYLRMMQSPGVKDMFCEDQLVAICMDMFMAGTETTSKSLGFAFLYLVRNQHVQDKARAEIDAVLGDRLPTLNDKPYLPYNEAIVLEAVRHFMGRTFGIPHRTLKDTKLCGFTIPKDTIVLPNFNNILMNNKLYEDPDSFTPERFIVDGKVSVPDKYIPFGVGKHRCMGEVLAKSNIFMFTVTMLQNFYFKPVPGEPLPSVNAIEGATPSAAPFQALVIRRKNK